jgi:Zn-dependent protease
MDDFSDNFFRLLLSLPAFVAAFALHEFAHAWMANRLGDDTPRRMGRLTLDPVVHLDPMGSLMFIITQLSGYGLGWAKPVPFNPRNFDHPRRDTMLVAVAGPVSNLLQVPFWLLSLFIFRLIGERTGLLISPYEQQPFIGSTIVTILSMGVVVNILLAAFNMIPFPPLDGHYILEGLGPPFITDFFNSIRPFSFMILLLMSSTGIISGFISPFMFFAYRLADLTSGYRFIT